MFSDNKTITAGADARSGLQFTLTTAGLPPQTFAVAEFSLHEALSTLFELNLELVSATPAVEFAAVLDKNATLTVWRDGQVERRITGIVTRFEQGDTGLHQTRYTMVVRPALWRTTLRRNSRIFQQISARDIITTLLKENGIEQLAFGLRYPHPEREFCVQYQETDFDFIQRLAAEEGLFSYFEFDKEQPVVVYTDDVATQHKGAALLYHPNNESHIDQLCIGTFTCGAQVRPTNARLKDYTFKNPRWQADYNKQASEMPHAHRVYEHFDFPGRFKSEQRGQDFSRYRLDALRNDAYFGHGQSNAFSLQPGVLFSLSGHPRDELNCRWQLVSIEHHGYQPQAHGTGQGTALANQFTFIPGMQTWRPSPLAKPMIDGPQIATVVGPANEEIFCDEYGRVRLQFPWDRYGKSDDHSSCWIRVTHPSAGHGFGMIAIPRVGQEVVVDFLHGDPDQPIVTGRTYNASNLPPNRLPVSKTQMSLRSQTHKGSGFNELRFEDEKEKEEVLIHAQKDLTTTVLHDRKTTVSNDHTENVTANQNISVGNDQSITVKNNQTLDVTVDQTNKIGGNQTSNIVGNQTLTVDGKQTATIQKEQEITVMLDQETTVQGNQKNTVFLDQTITVTKNQTTHISQNQITNVVENQTNTINGDQSTTVIKNIIINAGETISLVCGASSITLDSSGNITLQGVNISSVGSNSHTISAKTVSSSGTIENTVEGAVLKLNP